MGDVAEIVSHKRLSDDTTSGGSGDSDDDKGSQLSRPSTPDLLEDDEKLMDYLLSFSDVSGRYTDADPGYFYEISQKIKAPPVLDGYKPRQYRQGQDRNSGGHFHHQNNRDRDRQGNEGYRNQNQMSNKRKLDHSQSGNSDSPFYARPPGQPKPGNPHQRRRSQDNS